MISGFFQPHSHSGCSVDNGSQWARVETGRVIAVSSNQPSALSFSYDFTQRFSILKIINTDIGHRHFLLNSSLWDKKQPCFSILNMNMNEFAAD
jgi:hypothetical protein